MIPTKHPKIMAIITGFKSFFKDIFPPVSIVNPAVYVKIEIGRPYIIIFKRKPVPKMDSAKAYPI